jgi:hypothetical protein
MTSLASMKRQRQRTRARQRDERYAGRYMCLDCRQDILLAGEFFGLRDEVWLKANPRDDGMMCIGCIEARLGRQLTPEDFEGTPLDWHVANGPALSTRLMSRIGGPQNLLMRIHRKYGLVYFDHPPIPEHHNPTP